MRLTKDLELAWNANHREKNNELYPAKMIGTQFELKSNGEP